MKRSKIVSAVYRELAKRILGLLSFEVVEPQIPGGSDEDQQRNDKDDAADDFHRAIPFRQLSCAVVSL